MIHGVECLEQRDGLQILRSKVIVRYQCEWREPLSRHLYSINPRIPETMTLLYTPSKLYYVLTVTTSKR